MSRSQAPLAAVNIIGDQLIYLQLSSTNGEIFIHQWHTQPADAPWSGRMNCRELMTVMEHRAAHYQRLTRPTATDNVANIVQETYGGSTDYAQEITLDFQAAGACTHVISAHSSQVKKRQSLFTRLPAPVTIVEPAFQAILRAANFLLGHVQLHAGQVCTDWLIVELNQPLSSCLFCRCGALDKLQFAAEKELNELIDDATLIYYFGDNAGFSEGTKRRLAQAIELQLPQTLAKISDEVGASAAIITFGNALRGFSNWHH